MDWVQKIRNCFEVDLVYYTQHAKFELQNEEFGRIIENEIYEAICNAEVIEEYPTDEPYPSVLVYGRTKANRPVHLVCAYNGEEDETIIITVYEPDPKLWIDFKMRRKK